ncbi:MAG: hypothetical protein Q9196_006033, partial [Gyalolechia fulgens]
MQLHENGLGARLYLTPGLEAASSATGRFSTITYPVHKALIQARGLDGVRALLQPDSSSGSNIQDHMVIAVVDTQWTSLNEDSQSMYPVNAINLDRAEEAIHTFRESLNNSFNYEHAWFGSGMPKISAWLIDGTEPRPAIVKPTNRRLIETLTANVEEAIEKEESEQLQKQASTVVPTSTRNLMNTYIAKWAEDAHTELRNELDLAFTSKSWRKLAWWKLSWRADDVTYITSDILRQFWLVDADRSILYLAGRIEQAGLLPAQAETASNDTRAPDSNQSRNPPTNNQPDSSTGIFSAPPPTLPFSELIPISAYPPTPSPTTHPLSLSNHSKFIPSIAHTRQYLLATTIAPLQSLSQRLLLHALSTTFFASSLSAL